MAVFAPQRAESTLMDTDRWRDDERRVRSARVCRSIELIDGQDGWRVPNLHHVWLLRGPPTLRYTFALERGLLVEMPHALGAGEKVAKRRAVKFASEQTI